LLTLVVASENYLATTWRMGFLRCLFGFSLGVLVWLAHRKWPQRGSTAVEMAVIALAIVHVSLIESGYLTFLAPPVFAILVFVFANEGGALSTALKARPLRFLGLLSYAIYMLHELALARYFEVLGAIEKWLGIPMSNGQHIDSGPIRTELLTLGALAFTVFLAWFAWRFVEMPMREWSRRKLAGDQPKPD
jgi:peptidoglycan/LPS O-acetylase OafA/YrhL